MKQILPKKVNVEKFCCGCRHHLNFSCDILGNLTIAKKAQCYYGGYRETKLPNGGIRRYNNKQGAPNNDDVRG